MVKSVGLGTRQAVAPRPAVRMIIASKPAGANSSLRHGSQI